MPGGDRTGPPGEGPTTGRGMAYCTGNKHPGFGREMVFPTSGYTSPRGNTGAG